MPVQIVISDSSVIIDLAKAGLVEAAFALPYDFRIPDVMFEDELLYLGRYSREDLLSAGLTKSSLDGSGVGLALEYGATYVALSTNDRFALALAKLEHAVLLSGDRRLCVAAESEKIESRDLLWLIDELIARDTLGRDQLRKALGVLEADPKVALSEPEMLARLRKLGT